MAGELTDMIKASPWYLVGGAAVGYMFGPQYLGLSQMVGAAAGAAAGVLVQKMKSDSAAPS